jgi:hypothetical protein
MLMHYIPEVFFPNKVFVFVLYWCEHQLCGKVTSVEAVDEDVARQEKEQREFARELNATNSGEVEAKDVGAAATQKPLPQSRRPGYQLADLAGDAADSDDHGETEVEEDCPIPR